MPTYAQIDITTGMVGAVSNLHSPVDAAHMIPVEDTFDPSGKRWNGVTWEAYQPPAARKTKLTKLEAMERFTDQELADIYTAAKSSVQVEIWLEKFKAAQEIDLTNASFIAGVSSLEGAGLIGPGRAAEILA